MSAYVAANHLNDTHSLDVTSGRLFCKDDGSIYKTMGLYIEGVRTDRQLISVGNFLASVSVTMTLVQATVVGRTDQTYRANVHPTTKKLVMTVTCVPRGRPERPDRPPVARRRFT